MTIIPFPVLLTYFQLHFRLAIILSLGMECFDYALDKVLVKYSVIIMLDDDNMTGYPFEHRNVGNASKVKKKTIFDVWVWLVQIKKDVIFVGQCSAKLSIFFYPSYLSSFSWRSHVQSRTLHFSSESSCNNLPFKFKSTNAPICVFLILIQFILY